MTLLGTAAASSVTNVVITLTAGAAVGDTVVVGAVNNGSITSLSVTDSKGNTYTTAAITANVGTPVTEVSAAYCRLTTALVAGDTITVTLPNSRTREAFVAIAVPNTDASPADKITNSAGTDGAPTPGATGTLTKANEVAVLIVGSSVSTATATGYTVEGSTQTTVGSNERYITALTKVLSSTASENPVASTSAGTWGAILITLKYTPGGTPSTVTIKYWDGTSEVTGTVTVWDGTTEQPVASIEIAP